MAKKTSKPTKAIKAINASKPDKSAKAQLFPTFNDQALSTLTDKLEKGLLHYKTPPTGAAQHEKPEISKSERVRSGNIKEHTNGHGTGKKRDAKGNVKNATAANSRQPKKDYERASSTKKDDRDLLLQEIIALGGTEEDLDLVADVSSDDGGDQQEMHDDQPDTGFSRELSKFVTGLGIERQSYIRTTELLSGAIEDEEDEEEWVARSVVETFNIEGPVEDQNNLAKDKKTVIRLMFEARPDWHAALLPDLPSPDFSEIAPYRKTISELKRHAINLLETDGKMYASRHLSSTSSHRFLATIMSSGTLSDKVSALTLVVQESPVHTTQSLESLLALAKKRSRGQAVTALGAIKDLFSQGVVLPGDRRLKTFTTQPGLLGALQGHPVLDWKVGSPLPGNMTSAHLISWAYEDWLKDMYFDMLKVLEGWCNDEVGYARGRAVNYVFELLRDKPEQESNLLRLLVNKLGDPEKKIASRTSYLILQLQTSHPLMKPIIVRAIESELLLRPGQSSHSKYYAINTLNQTILSAKEEDVARRLLSIYFEHFVALLKKPQTQKTTSGPVLNLKGQIQGGGGEKGKKAKENAARQEATKSANKETTEKMISAVLTGINRALPFAKSDDLTLEQHMELLFRITHSSNFNTSIQALMLIQQLAVSKNISVERFYRTLYESLLDHRLITSSKHAMYLNLVFRALKSDLNIKRVKAFSKRLLQTITLHQPPFMCGALYLLRELEITFPGLASLITDPEERDNMDEEVFKDAPDDEMSLVTDRSGLAKNSTYPDCAATMEPGLVPRPERYDGRKRDPEHSNADKSCLWELIPYLLHFHPSVAMFAERLLSQNEMPPKPDLASHTLTAFLDRFVYRNPKAISGGLRGSSIMQPLSGSEKKGILVLNRSATHTQKPLNSEAFCRTKAENIAVDEAFFHKYFNQVGKPKQSRKSKVPKSGSDDIEGSEKNGEDEIWQTLMESRPEIEGYNEDDSDLEMFDLDDSDRSSWVGSDQDDGIHEDEEENEGSLGFHDNDDTDISSVEVGDEDAGSDMDELYERELQTGEENVAKNYLDGKLESRRSKRRKMKNLPTFASVEDYAEMLAQEQDEDM